MYVFVCACVHTFARATRVNFCYWIAHFRIRNGMGISMSVALGGGAGNPFVEAVGHEFITITASDLEDRCLLYRDQPFAIYVAHV